MPTPTGVHGLQLHRAGIRNPDLQRTDGSIFAMLDNDEGPTTRGQDYVVPFRTGRVAGSRRADTRTVMLHCAVTSAAGSFENALGEFHSIFDPAARAASTLVVTLPNGQVRRLFEVYVRSVTAGKGGYGMQEFMVELEALDPWWYGTWGNWSLDDGYYLDFGRYDGGGEEQVTQGPITVPSEGPEPMHFDDSAWLVIRPNSDPFIAPIDTLGDAETERVNLWMVYEGAGTHSLQVSETGVGFSVVGLPAPQTNMWAAYYFNNYDRLTTATNPTPTLNAANKAGEFLRLPAGRSTLSIVGWADAGLLEVHLNFLPAYRSIGA